MTEDLFGLERLARIQRSGIRNVYTPHKPIAEQEFFFGRQSEVARIMDAITTPGQHAVLYGDRGVGKSSLANTAASRLLHLLAGNVLVQVRCDSSTRFDTMAVKILRDLGVDPAPLLGGSTTKSTTSELGGGVGIGVLSGDARRTETDGDARDEGSTVSPASVAELLKGKQGLVVIDEFDALREPGAKMQVAELLKLLSDVGSRVTVLAVGVAETCDALLAGHPSVQRCLKEVALGRMSDDELRAIVLGNAKRAKLEFGSDVVTDIVSMSAGYPHFTHLLALKAAEEAIGEGRRTIGPEHLRAAIGSAVRDAEATLRDTYETGTRSYNTDMFVHVVRAAADIGDAVFSASTLREHVSRRCGRDVEQIELNNHFQRLVAEDDHCILKRVSKGFYRFSDPRMKSYVRMCERAELAGRRNKD